MGIFQYIIQCLLLLRQRCFLLILGTMYVSLSLITVATRKLRIESWPTSSYCPGPPRANFVF